MIKIKKNKEKQADYSGYACLKSQVFNKLLKTETAAQDRIFWGRLFHSSGAAKEKALLPYELRL